MIPAPCHPERPHKAKGMCKLCYNSARSRDPAKRARIEQLNREYLDDIKTDPALRKARRIYMREWRRKQRELSASRHPPR